MSEIRINETVLATCKDKVVIIAGGANGIGAATVTRFFHSGARVYFSDINTAAGEALAKSLSSSKGTGQASFCVNELSATGSVASSEATRESAKEYPTVLMNLLDINLNGCIYFSRVALAYLKEGTSSSDSKALTLIFSAAAFQEAPGHPGDASSKHGILGLARALRSLTPGMCNTRVSVICPWAPETAMTASHKHLFVDNDIPFQSADEVAVFIQLVSADEKLSGKAVYVGAGRAFDIEDGLERSRGTWLGEENVEMWKRQAEAFLKGSWSGDAGKAGVNGNGMA